MPRSEAQKRADKKYIAKVKYIIENNIDIKDTKESE